MVSFYIRDHFFESDIEGVHGVIAGLNDTLGVDEAGEADAGDGERTRRHSREAEREVSVLLSSTTWRM